MNRKAGIFSIAAIVVALAPAAGHAQAAPTIWDGIFSEGQAARGQQTTQANCSGCHNVDDWESPVFINSWAGKPLAELHEWVRSMMPFDAPGRLTSEEYTDILAYMLKLVKAPTGPVDLSTDPAELVKIQVTPATTD